MADRFARDVDLLPLISAAAVGVKQAEGERPQLLAGLGTGGRDAQVPLLGNLPSLSG